MGKLDNRRSYILKRCEGWKYRIVTKKIRGGQPVSYCSHEFLIGDNRYSFVERKVDGRIIVNPDFLIREGLPSVGGISKKYGELLFWDYFFSGRGWERVRKVSNNEKICLELISEFGYFSDWEEPETGKKKSEKKGLSALFKRKAVEKTEKGGTC